MSDRIETFARFLDAANTRLTPRRLERVDHRLSTTRPLVWRTSLHWIAWWSTLATLLCAALGAWSSRSPSVLPTSGELVATAAAINYLSIVACVLWAALQLRTPVGELGFGRHARLLALNALAICLIFAPARAFVLTATHGAANLLTENELSLIRQADSFRCFSPRAREHAKRNQAQLSGMLGRFGFDADWNFDHGASTEASSSVGLKLWDLSDPTRDAQGSASKLAAIEAKLRTIELSKELWSKRSGEYFRDHVQVLLIELPFAFLIALLIGMASHPRYAWRRACARTVLRLRFKQPKSTPEPATAGADHRWLVTQPIRWAAGSHRVLRQVLLCGALSLAFWLIASIALEGTWRFTFGLTILTTAAVWPFYWLSSRRTLPVPSITPSRGLVSAHFWCVIPVASLLSTAGAAVVVSHEPEWLAWSSVAAAFIGLIYGEFVVGLALLRLYHPISPPLPGLKLIVLGFLSFWVGSMCLAGIFVWLVVVLRGKKAVGPSFNSAAKFSLVALPGALATPITFALQFGTASEPSLAFASAALGLLCVIAYPFCARPMVELIARNSSEPKPT